MKFRGANPPVLSLDTLLAAYANGWFPMGVPGTHRVDWYSPDPRGILPLDRFHLPARLARRLRQARDQVRVDTAFKAVVQACATRDETWITEIILRSYLRLHELGVAHSVECWRDDRLVGGLYGVALRGAFFGESMFHTETDASKVALWALVERLRARGFTLLDIQWVTPHLRQFGAEEVSRAEYLTRLAHALASDRDFN